MNTNDVTVAENVGAGHPDKICDQIADHILDECLKADPTAKVACEVIAGHGQIFIGGEITTRTHVDLVRCAWDILGLYGYQKEGFTVVNKIAPQSQELKHIVSKNHQTLAGDQGVVVGYATDETPFMLPLPYAFATALLRLAESLRKRKKLRWVKADMKAEVFFTHRNSKTVLTQVVLAVQHDISYNKKVFVDNIRRLVVLPLIKKNSLNSDFTLLVNPAGSFAVGGLHADTGLTGRKIICDTYGPSVRHGGGSFSGKDYTKVDRTGAYAARWVAKNIVAASLAAKCEVTIAFVPGKASPSQVHINTFGTEKHEVSKIYKAVEKTFDLRLASLTKLFHMPRVHYLPLATYGHFGREASKYPWEKTNMAEKLSKQI